MTTKRFALAALLLAGSSLASAVPGSAQSGPPHMGMHGGHPGPHGGGFHAPAFVFAHHDFAHFTPLERQHWIGGYWNHSWHNGRWGWWWFAGGAWYFYGAPIYPYPTFVSDYYVDDDEGGPAGPGQYWYYCPNAGYFPYVQRCGMPWQPVPATPPPGYGAGPGAADNGPPPVGGPQNGPGAAYGPPQGMGPNSGPGPDDQPPPGYQGQDEGPGPGGYPPPGYGPDGGPNDQPPPPSNNMQPPNGYNGPNGNGPN